MERFVLHWGEMGRRWGINRSVAQIHALLYVTDEPLNAEQIQATLDLARSNVSTSMRELLGWGIVDEVSVRGDRRTYYTSIADVWEMFRRVVRGRKSRELDPTFDVVRACLDEAGSDEKFVRKRLGNLVAFFDDLTTFYGAVESMPQKTMKRLFRAGRRLAALLGGRRA